MKPVQAAEMSKAAARGAPIAAWIWVAVAGNGVSGVTVAQITRSTSSPPTPAISRARREAGRAKSDSASSSRAMRRSRIPVRVTIHSSEVSTIFSRSALVSIWSGTDMPVPTILARLMRVPPRAATCSASAAPGGGARRRCRGSWPAGRRR